MVAKEKQTQPQKRRRLKKKSKSRIKRRLTVFVFLFVCASVVFTVLKAPFFNIKTITCVGQETLTEKQIIEIAGVKLGSNIFSTGVKTMKHRLLENPVISESNVRRMFPNKIKIWVREAKTAMYIEDDTSYILVNDAGQIIKSISKAKDKPQEPPKVAKLIGFKPASTVPGESIAAKDDALGQVILDCVKTFKKLDMLEKITSISAADLSDLRFDYEDRLYVMLGSCEQLEYKLEFIKKVITENISEYEKALLDYRGKNLFVGPREDPDAAKNPSESVTAEEDGQNRPSGQEAALNGAEAEQQQQKPDNNDSEANKQQ